MRISGIEPSSEIKQRLQTLSSIRYTPQMTLYTCQIKESPHPTIPDVRIYQRGLHKLLKSTRQRDPTWYLPDYPVTCLVSFLSYSRDSSKHHNTTTRCHQTGVKHTGYIGPIYTASRKATNIKQQTIDQVLLTSISCKLLEHNYHPHQHHGSLCDLRKTY